MNESTEDPRTPAWDAIRSIAEGHAKTMQCNCDLDNWEPLKSTGHTNVCRITKATLEDLARHGIV